MKKTRVHYVRVRVVFNKPVTRSQAVVEAADLIHGDEYPDEFRCGAETMKIGSVVSSKKHFKKAGA